MFDVMKEVVPYVSPARARTLRELYQGAQEEGLDEDQASEFVGQHLTNEEIDVLLDGGKG